MWVCSWGTKKLLGNMSTDKVNQPIAIEMTQHPIDSQKIGKPECKLVQYLSVAVFLFFTSSDRTFSAFLGVHRVIS